jgi:DNA-binding response OmpR family regulator
MTAGRILLVEDEPAIAEAVEYALESEGYDVEVKANGADAVEVPADDYDLVVLDLMLPGLSGLEVCRRMRERSAVPIIMLTARGAEVDRVLGLELGADDYVPKPFSMAELIGRVRAILRRRRLDRESIEARSVVGELELDLVEQTVSVAGDRVELTPSEFRLLALLAREPERVFTRREIVTHLWRGSFAGDGRTCDVHVKNIRRKIERNPGVPERLVTVRGVGYMLRAA